MARKLRRASRNTSCKTQDDEAGPSGVITSPVLAGAAEKKVLPLRKPAEGINHPNRVKAYTPGQP